jgi:hypothetical protein
MMYWIVFALFTTLETFLDIFFSWFPFYYEIKIVFILWVLSPATRGSSLLYMKIVHPMLTSREKEIDELIEKTKQQGYSTFLQLVSSGFQYASSIFVNSALKGQLLLGNQLKKSLSINDVYESANVNSNNLGGGFRVAPSTINEDEESSDYDTDTMSASSRPLYPIVTNVHRKKSTNSTGIPTTTTTTLNSNRYEIIDNGILISDDNIELTTSTKKAVKPRRASSKQLGANMNPPTAANYKSNEVTNILI